MPGVNGTNFALAPGDGQLDRMTVPGVNDKPLDLDKFARHIIVRDNDKAGVEEANALRKRLVEEYLVDPSKIVIVAPPKIAPAHWDDADPLPRKWTDKIRIDEILDACGGDFVPWLDVDRNQSPKASMRNAIMALDRMGKVFSYNSFTHRITMGNQVIDDNLCIELRQQISEQYNFDPRKDNTIDAAYTLALKNKYHPILEYFDGLVWDGVERLDKWMVTYLGAEDTPLNRAIGQISLIASVRRIRAPGTKFDTIPVLEGPQRTGKSSAIAILAGLQYFSTS